ncbi:MAG: hypothetical protein AB7G75_30630 [Candidatus Binatia bacterium]
MTKSKLLMQLAVSGFCTLVLLLGVSADAWAQPTGMLKAYGAAAALGEYEGILRCLPKDFSTDKEDQRVCHHVLVMADGHVHPLYGMTAELHEQLNATGMNGKRVKLRGKYYPVSNAILVTHVSPVEK